MKTLPNGITVFNATPHEIYFWDEQWSRSVMVKTDEVINAEVVENFIESRLGVTYVSVQYQPTTEGQAIIDRALAAGADIIAGSIITAQTYRGQVVAMSDVPGYERAHPDDKRMDPAKFVVFT